MGTSHRIFDLEDYSDEIKTVAMDLISLFKIADSINVKQQIKLTDIESSSLYKEVFDRMLFFLMHVMMGLKMP